MDRTEKITSKQAKSLCPAFFSIFKVPTIFYHVFFCVWLVFFTSGLQSSASAMDQVTFRRGEKTLEVTGRLLLTAKDGGLAMLGRDGVLWLIPPEEKISHSHDSRKFEPLSRDLLSKQVLSQLPGDFRVFSTRHYMVFYNTSLAYAEWCGSLFERLYMAFNNYWTNKMKFELTEPEFPLIAIVFSERQEYLTHSRPELGDAAESVIGYYNILSNRMTMYDLTGADSSNHARASTAATINQVLSRPEAVQTVATIVHEATHQIAFNCGLHARLSDCPRWFNEGIAMYFETPDLRSTKGWNAIGNVSRLRLEQFQKYLAIRPADSLETLIRDDKRFLNAKQSLNAYAEAWALTYFLIRQHPKEYVSYLRMLSAKKPLIQDSPQQRVEEFQRAFGNLEQLDAEFLRYTGRIR